MQIRERLDEFTHTHELEKVVWGDRVEQVPSPSWWASDSVLIRGQCPDRGPVLAKIVSRHAWSWRNRHNSFRAAVAASESGVGPRVFAQDQEIGVLLTEHLGDGWRVARLDSFADDDFVTELLRVRQKFASLDVELDRRSPMIDLLQLREECDDRSIRVDPRIERLIDVIYPLRPELVRVRDHLEFHPSQGEATISNIMVGPHGEVKIVGWGSAASLSPVHDAALLVSEASPTVHEPVGLISQIHPGATAKERALIQAVAIIEHLRWALLTAIRANQDPDVSLDSIKYGLWRMTLAEIIIGDGTVVSEWKEAMA